MTKANPHLSKRLNTLEAQRAKHETQIQSLQLAVAAIERREFPLLQGRPVSEGGTDHGAPSESPDRGEKAPGAAPQQSTEPIEPNAPVPAPREVGRPGGASGLEAGAGCAPTIEPRCSTVSGPYRCEREVDRNGKHSGPCEAQAPEYAA